MRTSCVPKNRARSGSRIIARPTTESKRPRSISGSIPKPRASPRRSKSPLRSKDAPLVLDGEQLKLVSVALDGRRSRPPTICSTTRASPSPTRPRTLHPRNRHRDRAGAEHRARRALSVQGHLLHPMRAGRLPPHHLFPRPARQSRGLHRAHRGRQGALSGAAFQRQSGRERATCPAAGISRVWHDPFPKPSYLFALVAGDLGRIHDSFVTMRGRKVDLAIYVEHGNEPRALCHGFAQARDEMGRGDLRPRIRSRHLHDRRGLAPSISARWRTRASTSSTTRCCWPRPKPRPTTIMRASKASSPTNISTTGPATASPAATGSSCR